MTNELGIGIIGCGNISATYFRYAPKFRGIRIVGCADMNRAAADARAAEFGVEAMDVDALLADERIGLVVNLTIPDAHFAVSKRILQAGKHVYSEKPLVLSMAEGLKLKAIADEKGLSVGSAPDTFLGGAHQLARKAIDEGAVGTIIGGTCHVMNHGMEHWHPNPDFFYKPGGGPILDLGPYYIANLINLVGPVKRVAALATTPIPERTITSQPRKGETLAVSTPTSINALLEFANGATVTLSASWDVWAHRHANMELYGTEGSIFVPDPNFFGGTVEIAARDNPIEDMQAWEHPLGVPNEKHDHAMMANYRTAGLADMALAIAEKRDARCSLERSLHGMEILLAILRSGETGEFVTLETTCERPAALGIEEARALLA
ncbi:Gfo/Idh/MocA family protein [Pararhizobium haloflavum]|uniref:Gfo/Idh/MocA family protein n=1 Tax=Pararhizobium haloflavum TaxID=2037914 RepID=UPI000C19D302|nr:Gfo/Idh/MocA family oxidoreductase [Pararhizobium haloflavum]